MSDVKLVSSDNALSGLMWGTAAIMSYIVNQSILWAILHMIVSPFYIPYWILTYYLKFTV